MILEACFHEKVFLLLDEYDTPFISASSSGYYDEVRDVLAGMLSSSLKGNMPTVSVLQKRKRKNFSTSAEWSLTLT